jgi:hypothetical protein
MKRTIYHFSVKNGCCSVIEADKQFVMVVDLNYSEKYDSTYEMLQPYFRLDDQGRECLDVLCITHGHIDHCCGFKEFKEKIDAGKLVIGAIWHQGYDRRDHEKASELEDDYLSLMNEIDRRKKLTIHSFGDYEETLIAGNQPSKPTDINFPADFVVQILNPSKEGLESEEFDCNNLSCVLNINFTDLGGILYSGDTESKAWQNSIISNQLSKKTDLAKSKFLVVAHHGSYTFFGQDRDAVISANPFPENYEALDYINPNELILSAESRFPTSRDTSGDNPPHYAAYKWYHRWFEENHEVSEDDKHPSAFHYTSDGNIRMNYSSTGWTFESNFDIDEERKKRELGKKVGSKVLTSGIVIGGSKTAAVGAYGKD